MLGICAIYLLKIDVNNFWLTFIIEESLNCFLFWMPETITFHCGKNLFFLKWLVTPRKTSFELKKLYMKIHINSSVSAWKSKCSSSARQLFSSAHLGKFQLKLITTILRLTFIKIDHCVHSANANKHVHM